jgi:excisionase family DNA binding protein
MNQYLSLAEAAEELGLSRTTMYRLRRDGAIKEHILKLPSGKVVRKYIRRDELMALIEPPPEEKSDGD